MSVRDVDALVAQQPRELARGRGIVERPDEMALLAEVRVRDKARGAMRHPALERPRELALRIGDHAEHRTGVRPRRSKEREPVGLRLGEGLLVRTHDPASLLIQTERAEDPSTPQPLAPELEVVV